MRFFVYYEQLVDPDVRRIIAVPAVDIYAANARMKAELGDEFNLPLWQFKWRDADVGVLREDIPENAEVLL